MIPRSTGTPPRQPPARLCPCTRHAQGSQREMPRMGLFCSSPAPQQH